MNKTPETKTPTRAEALAEPYFVTARIEEITVAQWEELNGRSYTLSGDPTRFVYGVGFKRGYNDFVYQVPNTGEGITNKDAQKIVDALNRQHALSATDAPIVEGEFERIASDARSYAGNFLKHEDYKQREADIVAVRNALYAQGRTQSVQEGWKLVPIEPTEEMIGKGNFAGGEEFPAVETIYKAMLSAAPPVTGGAWLPIESAPKDGTEFLAITKYGKFCVCQWDNGEWRKGEPMVFPLGDAAYLWQPLPTPPSSQTRGG